MGSILTLNGNRSEIRPRYPVSINNTRIARPININGLPSIGTVINGFTRPPMPSGCVLNLPLGHPALSVAPGGSFTDLVGGNSCTVTNAIWTPQGRVFAGTAYIMNSTANWRSSDSLGAIGVWFKTTDASSGGMLFSSTAASSLYFLAFGACRTAGHIWVYQKDNDVNDVVSGDINCSDGAWHLGFLISTGTAYAFVVDGVSDSATVEAGANTGDWFADTRSRINFAVGVFATSLLPYKFTGTIGEVWVFSQALSLAQIQQIYLATRWRYQ